MPGACWMPVVVGCCHPCRCHATVQHPCIHRCIHPSTRPFALTLCHHPFPSRPFPSHPLAPPPPLLADRSAKVCQRFVTDEFASREEMSLMTMATEGAMRGLFHQVLAPAHSFFYSN
jgi:hypothetical protein